MKKNQLFAVSFRCYYPEGEPQKHYQNINLQDIPKWIEAYKFTHPNCTAVTCKVWFSDIED